MTVEWYHFHWQKFKCQEEFPEGRGKSGVGRRGSFPQGGYPLPENSSNGNWIKAFSKQINYGLGTNIIYLL